MDNVKINGFIQWVTENGYRCVDNSYWVDADDNRVADTGQEMYQMFLDQTQQA